MNHKGRDPEVVLLSLLYTWLAQQPTAWGWSQDSNSALLDFRPCYYHRAAWWQSVVLDNGEMLCYQRRHKIPDKGSNLLRWIHVDNGKAETGMWQLVGHLSAYRIQTFILWLELVSKPINGLGITLWTDFADKYLGVSSWLSCTKWCLWLLISLTGRYGLVTKHRLWS